MKKSSILFYLFLFAIGTNQVSAHHPVRSANDTLSAKVDQIFADWDKPDSPGCALAVIQDGKTVYSRGYGMADLEHDIPISPQTVFYIGSTSKQFVTFSIALLAEQGKLGLDDNIRKYLPEFPDYGQPITIRHLIHHTSGIRDYLTLWSLAGRNYLDYMPEDVVLDMICRQKELNFSPGEQHLYSNSCYFLLAVIVERASGQSLREYADKHIFKPLAMKNTHFHDNNKHIIKKRAYGYAPGKIGGFDQLIMRFDLVGSGGLYTCVEDLYLWDQNFYHNKLGKGGQEIIDLMH
ncbi:MAG: serine hydrolase domain-containing protein, partial [bacterium]